jgi:hypothetical protein
MLDRRIAEQLVISKACFPVVHLYRSEYLFGTAKVSCYLGQTYVMVKQIDGNISLKAFIEGNCQNWERSLVV